MCSRQTGIDLSVGRYIVFVDSDDYLPADALATMYDHIESVSSDIVCFTFFRTDVNTGNNHQSNNAVETFGSEEAFARLLRSELTHSLCAKIYRRRLFNNIPPAIPHQTNGEDMMLFYRLVGSAEYITTVNTPVYYYFHNPSSATRQSFSKQKFDQLVRCWNYRYDMFKDREDLKDLSLAKNISDLEQSLRNNIPDSSLNGIDSSLMRDIEQYLRTGGLRGRAALMMLRHQWFRRLVNICMRKM